MHACAATKKTWFLSKSLPKILKFNKKAKEFWTIEYDWLYKGKRNFGLYLHYFHSFSISLRTENSILSITLGMWGAIATVETVTRGESHRDETFDEKPVAVAASICIKLFCLPNLPNPSPSADSANIVTSFVLSFLLFSSEVSPCFLRLDFFFWIWALWHSGFRFWCAYLFEHYIYCYLGVFKLFFGLFLAFDRRNEKQQVLKIMYRGFGLWIGSRSPFTSFALVLG